MKFLPIPSILISDGRQRRAFPEDALAELRSSIQTVGLMQAVVVRDTPEGPLLVAGERRLRAMTDLHELGLAFSYAGEPVPEGQVPCVSLGDLSPLEAWEAELDENIRRQDLTWQERAAAEASLVELRREQAVEAGRPPPTLADVARELHDLPADKPAGELGDYSTNLRTNVIVSKFLSDPEVSKAKSAKEALKILKRKEETRKNTELAATLGATFTSSAHSLHQADCLQWLAAAQPAQFDIILTDPPYGMGAHEFGDSGTGGSAGAHFYDDSYESWGKLMVTLPVELFRVAKPEAHAYLFCDIDRFHELRTLMAVAGWEVFRTPIIWHNPDGFRAPWPEHGPQRRYECILYAMKGKRKVNAVAPDVIVCGKDASLGHPAQKPVGLLVDLLRRSARPDSCVLDPFAGSGSTLEACHELKLACTAVENNPAAYAVAAKRLASLGAFDEGLF
jgi:site-specific DNA-methyltransferase (adenine-specific)